MFHNRLCFSYLRVNHAIYSFIKSFAAPSWHLVNLLDSVNSEPECFQQSNLPPGYALIPMRLVHSVQQNHFRGFYFACDFDCCTSLSPCHCPWIWISPSYLSYGCSTDWRCGRLYGICYTWWCCCLSSRILLGAQIWSHRAIFPSLPWRFTTSGFLFLKWPWVVAPSSQTFDRNLPCS